MPKPLANSLPVDPAQAHVVLKLVERDPGVAAGGRILAPEVLEVAAVAQDDERSGEVVALFVVKKSPTLTADQIVEHCKQELTGYKIPKFIYFRDELPKTNVAKILRRSLGDELKHKAA